MSAAGWTGHRVAHEVAGSAATVAVVIAAAAIALSVLDAVPGYLADRPRGVRAYRSIDEVALAFGERVRLPAVFPDTLRWPPASIRVATTPRASVLLTFVGRQSGVPELVLAQTLAGAGLVSDRLLAPGVVLQRTAVDVGSAAGDLRRVQLADGDVWNEIVWRDGTRAFVVRSTRPVPEVLQLARSVR